MKEQKLGNYLVIRLEKGEEIVSTLEDLFEENHITAGSFHGIGAVSRATLGHYSLQTKDYREKELNQPLEIASLQGTITEDGIHPHVCLGDKEMNIYGGHLVKGKVAATCEVIVSPISGRLARYHDEEIGLDLLDI